MSPDSIVADFYKPQNWNRYLYVEANPVNFNDPTGHCREKDQDCIDMLHDLEAKYGVTINDEDGAWTVEGLTGIGKGMAGLSTAMGEDAFKAEFKGVTFYITKKIDERTGMGTHGIRDVVLGFLSKNDELYIRNETVHELGHIWDKDCGNCISKGLLNAIGGDYGEYVFGRFVPRKYDHPGNPPSTHAWINPGCPRLK